MSDEIYYLEQENDDLRSQNESLNNTIEELSNSIRELDYELQELKETLERVENEKYDVGNTLQYYIQECKALNKQLKGMIDGTAS